MRKQVNVGVVIATTRPEKLERCMFSLRTGSVQPAEIHAIVDVERKGPAWARNQGIKEVRAPWTLILDDDTVLEHSAIETLMSRAGLSQAVFGHLYSTHHDEFSTFLHDGHGQFRVPADSSNAGYCSCHPSHMLFPTAPLQLAMYDESFPYPKFEDRELGWRLESKYGLKFHYVDNAVVWHDHKVTLLDWVRLQERHAEEAMRMNKKCDCAQVFRDLGVERAAGMEFFDEDALLTAMSAITASLTSEPKKYGAYGDVYGVERRRCAFRHIAEFARICHLRRLMNLSPMVHKDSKGGIHKSISADKELESIVAYLELKTNQSIHGSKKSQN